MDGARLVDPAAVLSDAEKQVLAAAFADAQLRTQATSTAWDEAGLRRLIGDTPRPFGSAANLTCLTEAVPGDLTHDADTSNDGGWIVSDFCTEGGCCAFAPDCHHNDDDSAGDTIAPPGLNLPFTFDFYGTPFTETFINNNGNISFGAGFATFTSSGFPVANFPMVAPFWGDVDTRPIHAGGHVWQKFVAGNRALAVVWENVGYFSSMNDKLNTFALVISDGTVAEMGLGNNVCLCYDDMQWTTGSASGGIGGFGGTPATVGVNKGDGVNFFQIGRFDHEGVDYDGPDGVNDGVSYLDGRSYCFNSTGDNIPPIPVGAPVDPIVGQCGQALHVTFSFLPPEGDQQVVTVDVDDPQGAQAAGLVAQVLPSAGNGQPAVVVLDWVPAPGSSGVYTIEFTGSDNYDPPPVGQTTVVVTFEIDCPQSCCTECEIFALLQPVLPGGGHVSSTHPCFATPVPDPPSEECCASVALVLPLLPGQPSLSSTHPCFGVPAPAPADACCDEIVALVPLLPGHLVGVSTHPCFAPQP